MNADKTRSASVARLAPLAAVVAIAAIAALALGLSGLRPSAPSAAPEPASAAAHHASSAPATSSAPAPKATGPMAAPVTPPAVEECGIGCGRVWSVKFSQAISLGAAADGAPDGVRLSGSGTLRITLVEQTRDWSRYMAQLDDSRVSSEPAGAMDADTRAIMQASMAAPFGYTTDSRGAVTAMHLPPGAHDAARGLLRTLVASMQVVRPAMDHAAQWTTEETDALGTYSALYTRSGSGLTKTKNRYQTLTSSQPGNAAMEAGTQLDIQRSEWTATWRDGWLDALTHREDVSLGWGESQVASSKWELDLVLQGYTRDAKAAQELAALGDALETVAVDGPEASAAGDARQHDEQAAGSATPEEILSHVENASVDPEASEARAQDVVRLAARLRLSPEATARVAEWTRDPERLPEAASVGVGALEAAGTPEARAALREIAADSGASLDARENAIAALGGQSASSPESVSTLRALNDAEDPALRSAALLALGTAAGQGAADALEPVVSALQAPASPDDAMHALQAAGNAGAPEETLSAIEAALADPSPAIRKAAVEALRFSADPRADEWIAGVLTRDTATAVRLGAIFALSFRQPQVAVPLLSQTIASDPDAAVRGAALTELAVHAALDASIVTLIQIASAQDPDASVRAQAESYLAQLQ